MVKIELQNVSLGYRHHVILNDITFNLMPGELVGLMGPGITEVDSHPRFDAHYFAIQRDDPR